MMHERYLIVNGDDFGLSMGINRGIIQCHREGILTSASLMVRGSAAAEAAAYAEEHPDLALGLHLDLGEWAYHEGEWVLLYEVVPEGDFESMTQEILRQLSAFRSIVGRDPTHLDSHQHVHQHEPLRSLMLELARNMALPLRHFDPRIYYSGGFYGQAGKGYPFPAGISVEGLIELLTGLPPGTTELGCHPGLGHDYQSVYQSEREEEVKTLCDPRVRDCIRAEGIELRSFLSFKPSA